jgi:hypothetical protein
MQIKTERPLQQKRKRAKMKVRERRRKKNEAVLFSPLSAQREEYFI